ncbi:glycosyltransferase [Nocardioides sp. LML1-1-1.1]|uniref:glycosyltransferase n=1 Tax=Nocardioides sp. LML1-1-1.1 TaxID=3135248 RepID=UPI003417A185
MPEHPLRVLVVQLGGVLGGAERWQLPLAGATDRLDLRVVALGAGPAADAWAERGRPVTRLPAPRRAADLPGLVARLVPELRRSLPDVVLVHGVKAALVAVPAARALGIPVVWVRHDASYGGRVVGLLDRLTDGQVATSAWLLEGRAARNPLVLNPARVPDVLSRAQARAELDVVLPAGTLVLGMGARLARSKGVEDALRALAEPAAAAWVLVVAGIPDPAEPGERERLLALAARLGVADRFVLLPALASFGAVVRAFDAVAVLTRPTADAPWLREGFGMTALEALAGGVPLVVVPPVDAVAAEGGLAVPPGAPAALARTLDALTDPALRRRLGEAGERRARDFPDAAEAADRLADFLGATVHRPGAGRTGERPALSVVTTVFNDAEATRALLAALRPQLRAGDEVVVVDGGSTDATAEVVQVAASRDPRIRLLVCPGVGISEGRNIGIAAAAHDEVVCTDAGCVPAPGWLEAMRRAFATHPDVDLWTGTYRVEADLPWERALAAVGYPRVEELARPTPFVRAYGRFLGRTFDATMPTGRSIGFRRAAWRRAGGFPVDLATGEDVLFGRTIVATGGTARLVRDAEVSWAQRPTLRANLTMYRRYGEGSGHSGDARLLGRDVARVAGYAGALALVARGGRGRALVAAGSAAYLSLPLLRALRGPAPLRTAALVPPVAAARDLAKAYGALSVRVPRRSGRR